jgi:hypothetical protein
MFGVGDVGQKISRLFDEGFPMGPAYWWLAATVFGIIAVYYYSTRNRAEKTPTRELSESADSRT